MLHVIRAVCKKFITLKKNKNYEKNLLDRCAFSVHTLFFLS